MVNIYVKICAIVLAIAGCGTISDQQEEQLTKNVDCLTAREDIAALEVEKASVAKQTLAGFNRIVPPTSVVIILSGEYYNMTDVATGKYNEDIDAKIWEIKTACKIE